MELMCQVSKTLSEGENLTEIRRWDGAVTARLYQIAMSIGSSNSKLQEVMTVRAVVKLSLNRLTALGLDKLDEVNTILNSVKDSVKEYKTYYNKI